MAIRLEAHHFADHQRTRLVGKLEYREQQNLQTQMFNNFA